MVSKKALNIYLLLWCIFNVTFSASMMVSRPIYVILFMKTMYYGYKSLTIPTFSPYIKGLLILVCMFLIYGSISIVRGDTFFIEAVGKDIDSTIYLISISISLIPIFAFYYFSYIGILDEKIINKWIPIFILSSIATFYFSLKMLIGLGRNEDSLVINGGYSFISIIPLLFFVDKRNLRWIYLTIILIFSVLSVKRGAILIAFISAVFLVFEEVKTAPRRKKKIIGLTTFFFVVLLAIIVYYLYSSNPFLQLRLQSILEGNTSHRDVIYDNIIKYWLTKETEIQQFFGLGASATLKIGDNYAHNDWLEILINNGLFGIFIFSIYWIFMLVQCYRYHKKSPYRNAFILLLCIGILKTLFSMYYNDIITPMAVCLGYCSGVLSKNQRKKRYSYIEANSKR